MKKTDQTRRNPSIQKCLYRKILRNNNNNKNSSSELVVCYFRTFLFDIQDNSADEKESRRKGQKRRVLFCFVVFHQKGTLSLNPVLVEMERGACRTQEEDIVWK
jgi:hypothetical protein